MNDGCGMCGVVDKATPQTNDAVNINSYVHICTFNYIKGGVIEWNY